MIDFVIQPGLQPDVERHIRESADIAAECFGRIVPRLPVQRRLMDTNEVANVVAATDPSGVMDMRAFVAKQRDDRRQYAVPDTVRTMSFVALPTKVIEGSRLFMTAYGYSIGKIGEAVTSVARITDEAGTQHKAFLSQLIAYTAVHETGHLFGLVKDGAPRQIAGKHCGNVCVMGVGSSVENTFQRIRTMGNHLHFCVDCTADIRAAAESAL